ncbi:bacillithiol biosynthesis cysteine-adding enzyme BshC [Candidatus Poribacteria bacterium]
MRILSNAAELMSGSKLFSDYVNDPEKIAEFYPSHFRDELSWRRVMDEVSGRRRDYSELARILKRQNSELGVGQEVMENIDRLATPPVFAVVTGQQVGILTGPLYTIYKAMTTVKLAQKLNERYDAEFVPIFWMESNDHDIEEANHINVLDSDSELLKLEYLPEERIPGCSMKDVTVDEGFGDLILNLENRLPDTEFKGGVFQTIREAYLPAQSLGYGFGRMIAKILGRYGLVFLDPSDPDVKGLMSPVLRRNVESPLEATRIVNTAGERAESKDYESQIEKSWDSTCLFMEDNCVRRKLFFRDGRFIMDETDKALCKEELLSILQAEPWRFSPNVALRPVTQDYMLPTAAYVAGPGEISYFAQLQELYGFLDVSMPVIYPRASVTVVENKVQRVMEKNELTLADLSEHHEHLFSRLSKHTAEERLDHILESSKSKMEGIFEELSAELTEFDPGLKNMVESTRRKVDHQVNILAERAYKAQRSRDDVLRNQIKRACMNVYPDGKPQERMFNIVQYLVLYGPQFLDDVMATIEIK